MKKIDYKNTLKEYYKPSVKKVMEVDVPAMNFLMISGKHHEIYLSDIRRCAPKNWKTIIRQSMS